MKKTTDPRYIAARAKLTQETLRSIFKYDPETGLFTRLSPLAGFKVGEIVGTQTSHGYWRICIGRRGYMAHRLAWLYMLGDWPRDQIDHINRNKSDNRWANLREATRSTNAANIGVNRYNTSGVKGVSWHKENKRWQAQITVNKKIIYLGSFVDKQHAAIAYQSAAKAVYGEFACLEPLP